MNYKSPFAAPKTGFTLVETMVAITILMIGVLGPLALAARGISDGFFAQNQLTASLLAQEAVEAIINERNSQIILAGTSPGVTNPFGRILAEGENGPRGTIAIDGRTGTIEPTGCPESGGESDDGCLLVFDESTNSYRNAVPGEVGIFRRKITVSRSASTNPDEIKVEVTIRWKNKTQDKSFTVIEYLYAD